MSQSDLVISALTDTGTTLATKLNNWRAALYSMQRGASRPSYATAGFQWLDDVSSSEWYWYLYDGTSDIKIATFNPVTHEITFEISNIALETVQAENVNGVKIRSANGTLVGTFGAGNTANLGIDGNLTALNFIGNGSQLTSLSAGNIATGTVATARLGSGTANSTTYLRGDQTWALVPPGGQYFGTSTIKAIAYNSDLIAENIAVTENSFSVGPITIDSGYAVTISSAKRWVIL